MRHVTAFERGLQAPIIGLTVLENPSGGLNPLAVNYVLKQGARFVWMAPALCKNHMDDHQRQPRFHLGHFRCSLPTTATRDFTLFGSPRASQRLALLPLQPVINTWRASQVTETRRKARFALNDSRSTPEA
ncbi:MAG: DUF6282 family protein [Pseudomonadota bacterium]|nr:DUF6282 family protein [Pseudomonadota bacterium]